MGNSKAIGIDLGTTNSCVATLDPTTGRTVMLRNVEGDLLTPSIVLFDDAEVIVGREARSALCVTPDRVVQWVKRDMGAPVFNRPIRGEYLPPEVIQACILRKLRADVTPWIDPQAEAVITVPAYFDEPRRKATADAGEMAGLKVLDICNEPTAAALAFGETLGYLAPTGQPLGEMTLLVYDLGGGTFDVTLLALSPGMIRTIATDGDVMLGGYDWDMRLVHRVADAFQAMHGSEIRGDAGAMNRLLCDVVELKHSLTARQRASIRFDYGGQTVEMAVTRQEFEELTADLLERTAYTTRQVLTAARMDWSHVHRVLLVGGSSRMPMVSAMLRRLSGLEPDHSVNPDEAVARGAALYANYLLTRRTAGAVPSSFEVTNVNAHSLGVEGIDPPTGRKRNVVVIPRNTSLPATVTERFVTNVAGQHSIVLQVLEGESVVPAECTAIGRTVIRNLPPGLPQGWPVDVTFVYGENGRLSVYAVVAGTDREATLDLERDGLLSRDGIARWKETVTGSTAFTAVASALADPVTQPTQVGAVPLPLAGLDDDFSATMSAYPAGAAASPQVSTPAGAAHPVPGGPLAPAPALASAPLLAGDDEEPGEPARGRRPGLAINLIGHVVAALLGLAIGYLILSFLQPELFPLPW